jgi:hypothetical protein
VCISILFVRIRDKVMSNVLVLSRTESLYVHKMEDDYCEFV